MKYLISQMTYVAFVTLLTVLNLPLSGGTLVGERRTARDL
jgi:hypothetical protein